jgi:hypothetical protein
VKQSPMKPWTRLAGALALAALLGACGGGGGGGESETQVTTATPGPAVPPSTPAMPVTPDAPVTPEAPVTPIPPPAAPATPTVAGLYFGTTTAAGGTFDALILDSGRMYGMQGTNGGIDNVFFGNGTVTATGYASTTGATLSTSSGLSTTPASVTLTGAPKSVITGTMSSAAAAATFTANYRSSFEEKPALATVVGTYGGQFSGLGPGDGFLLNLAVDAAGEVSGTTASGCRHTGKLTPDAGVNVYAVTVTFAVGCRKQGTLAGHAMWQAAVGSAPATLTIFAIAGDFRDGWIFLGGRQ